MNCQPFLVMLYSRPCDAGRRNEVQEGARQPAILIPAMPAKKKISLAKPSVNPAVFDKPLLTDLRQLILDARQQVARIVDAGLTLLYWQIGCRIHKEVLLEKRADYGAQIVVTVSRDLEAEFGGGLEEKNVYRMTQFAEIFPDREIVVTLSRQLSWSHFGELLSTNRNHLSPATSLLQPPFAWFSNELVVRRDR